WKSRTAFLLARAAALKGKSVLLVDADTRTASLSRLVGKSAGASLLTMLYDRKPASDAILHLEEFDFCFMPTTVAAADPSMIFQNDRAEAVLGVLRKHFDHIVVDGPALTGPSDSFVMPSVFDTGIYILPTGRSRLGQIAESLNLFRRLDLGRLGIVLAGGKEPRPT
ncbi:MAG: hypothetical protein AAFY03_04195, partial [Pseudomonadota bacterium]